MIIEQDLNCDTKIKPSQTAFSNKVITNSYNYQKEDVCNSFFHRTAVDCSNLNGEINI